MLPSLTHVTCSARWQQAIEHSGDHGQARLGLWCCGNVLDAVRAKVALKLSVHKLLH